MNRLSRFRILPFILFVGAIAGAGTGCVNADNSVVLPSGPTVHYPTDDVGLASGCSESEPTVGRLRGLVYTVPPETRSLPPFDALSALGALCMDRLAVSERRIFPGFRNRNEWFAIDFQGAFVVAEPGLYQFRLTSDDGSKLYIDGAQVIDNDGFHVTRAAEGAVSLGAGTHRIDVPYWQGPGPLTLVLESAAPGSGFEVFRLDRGLGGGS